LLATTTGLANAFSAPSGPSFRLVDTSLFASIGLYYSTSTGNTETVAGYIAEAIGNGVEAEDIGDVSGDEALKHDALIVGSPTWITGADKQRSGTEWDTWLYSTLPKLDMYVET
jgi:flavodoxin